MLSGQLEEAVYGDQALAAELTSRVASLLDAFTYDAAEEFASWFRTKFSGVASARAPAHAKQLKADAEWFLSVITNAVKFGRHGTGSTASPEELLDGRRKDVAAAWDRLKAQPE